MTQFKDVAIHDNDGTCRAIEKKVTPDQVCFVLHRLLSENDLINPDADVLYQVNVVDHEPDERAWCVRVGFKQTCYIEKDVTVKASSDKGARACALNRDNWIKEGNDRCEEIEEYAYDIGVVGRVSELDE